MWFILLVTCCALFTEIVALPTPQDYNFLPFDVDSLGQGNLPPQGFSTPQRETRQVVDDNGVSVTRYFFDFNELGYKYT